MIKQKLAIKQSHIMNKPFDSSAWQQVERLKTQLRRNLIEQEI